ncbi:MAG: glycosyltransferase [Actinomycetota bacterium]|nr:glycosyltransferase [Actinomycetota bacterium]
MAARLAKVLGIRDVFTFAAEPELAGELFPGRSVRAHRLGLHPVGRRNWQWLLPAMPRGWSRADLSPYEVVITSTHACANAIRVRPGAVHISYCHTPMRYAWEWRSEIRRLPAALRPPWPAIAAALRRADRNWADNVTVFIANSHHVAGRIQACYGRDATVVHPPVDTAFWSPDAAVRRESFFLVAGRLVAYKRPDIAVHAARMAGVELVVAGNGPELARLRRMAGERTRFVMDPPARVLRDLYRRSQALVNPGVEDFGITMVEAQACGTPVIATAAGGAREIVIHGETGSLYDGQRPEPLARILSDWPSNGMKKFDSRAIQANARRFDTAQFDEGVRRVVEEAVGGGLG